MLNSLNLADTHVPTVRMTSVYPSALGVMETHGSPLGVKNSGWPGASYPSGRRTPVFSGPRMQKSLLSCSGSNSGGLAEPSPPLTLQSEPRQRPACAPHRRPTVVRQHPPKGLSPRRQSPWLHIHKGHVCPERGWRTGGEEVSASV